MKRKEKKLNEKEEGKFKREIRKGGKKKKKEKKKRKKKKRKKIHAL